MVQPYECRLNDICDAVGIKEVKDKQAVHDFFQALFAKREIWEDHFRANFLALYNWDSHTQNVADILASFKEYQRLTESQIAQSKGKLLNPFEECLKFEPPEPIGQGVTPVLFMQQLWYTKIWNKVRTPSLVRWFHEQIHCFDQLLYKWEWLYRSTYLECYEKSTDFDYDWIIKLEKHGYATRFVFLMWMYIHDDTDDKRMFELFAYGLKYLKSLHSSTPGEDSTSR